MKSSQMKIRKNDRGDRRYHDRVTEETVGVAHHEARAESDSGGASR